MTVYFQNPGHFEIDLISTMGVNVKDNENAIGYFGTGLKYAIAVLVRSGDTVSLQTGGDLYEFFAAPVTYRGKEFKQLFYRHAGVEFKLPYTTELGKNWTPLMAYRELVTNARDEGGDVYDSLQPGDGVCITVSGAAIAQARADHGKMFLTTPVLQSLPDVDIHAGNGTDSIYYRGIYVGNLGYGRALGNTYNIKRELVLTEDRNAQNPWSAFHTIRNSISGCTVPALIRAALLRRESMEIYTSFTPGLSETPSSEFLDFLEENSHISHLQKTADAYLARFRPQTRVKLDEVKLTDTQAQDIKTALSIIAPICSLRRDEFIVVESLGPNVFGVFDPDTKAIQVSKQTINNGASFIAATLFEEWCHKKHSYEDESRAFQQYLIDTIIGLLREP